MQAAGAEILHLRLRAVTQRGVFMLFLIDYENVGNAGMKGYGKEKQQKNSVNL